MSKPLVLRLQTETNMNESIREFQQKEDNNNLLSANHKWQKTFSKHVFHIFSEEIMLDITCESSAWKTFHMQCHALFSLKNKKQK